VWRVAHGQGWVCVSSRYRLLAHSSRLSTFIQSKVARTIETNYSGWLVRMKRIHIYRWLDAPGFFSSISEKSQAHYFMCEIFKLLDLLDSKALVFTPTQSWHEVCLYKSERTNFSGEPMEQLKSFATCHVCGWKISLKTGQCNIT